MPTETSSTLRFSDLRICDLRCEYEHNPLGIDSPRPRLSWKLEADRRAVVQSAYQVRVRDQAGELWDSGRVESGQSLHVTYGGPALRSGQRCEWQVRVWDGAGIASPWSETAWWEMGLLSTDDWKASWIEPGWDEDPTAFNPAPYLRRIFNAVEVTSARLYVTAHGLYELTLNGRPVSDALFTPGLSAYPHRLQYQTYDVTSLVQAGENVIGVILGDGWYRGKYGSRPKRNLYGKRLGLLLQLSLRYADGSETLVLSDGDWRVATGPILKSDLQDGEVYDARLEIPGWDRPGFDASAWQGVRLASYSLDTLAAPVGPPVRRQEPFAPVAILTTPAGETVVDFGQNFSGVVQIKVSGPAGAVVHLRHGETLDEDGNFTMKNLEMMGEPLILQEIHYTLRGEGEEVYTPHFTTMGFRYVKVIAWPGAPRPDQFLGIALYSDLPQTGEFACSNPAINRLHQNILWSQKSNFLEIPTDCPTRERAGWAGDAQVYARTASFLMETAGFLSGWLLDLAAEQREDGLVYSKAPSVANELTAFLEGSAGWGDAATIVPWTLYQAYGDPGILAQQYDSMKRWVEYQRSRSPQHIWNSNMHWGEWLEPDVPGLAELSQTLAPQELGRYMTHPHLATAYYAHSAEILSQAADVLGKIQDASEYAALAQEIKAAYLREFVGEDGRIEPDRQASYVRVLAFDLLPVALRPLAVKRLVELIEAAGNHLATGFLSTGLLCHALSDHGRLDTAYALLEQDTIPSWLYEVKQGATTIWENWRGIDENGVPHESLNHYSPGAIGSWLYEVVAGIKPLAPGYQRIAIRPRPGGSLSAASAVYDSLYGKIACAWQIQNGQMRVEVTIPPNTQAEIRLPGAALEQVLEGGARLAQAEGLSDFTQQDSDVRLVAGSGSYRFEYPYQLLA